MCSETSTRWHRRCSACSCCAWTRPSTSPTPATCARGSPVGSTMRGERTNDKGETGVQYVVLDMGAVGSIDTSRTSMLDELKKTLNRRAIQIVLANPGSEIMKKLDSSKVLELIGHEWIFPTVGESVAECDFMLHSHKPGMVVDNALRREHGLIRYDLS
ncbi:sulfate transporter 3.2-like isoform X1 [Hordeum vulgare subsp. vulgare]|uniref:sulfate transporter 3.2-like isoform X1 n=1 Tax=Hordeum vulgare subsp. vulgare TaxID=112509 RepID=UPI000B47F9C1|nr:sulfate transporter 3.2-like isoform X1 [Hordeum vulgare subsp. vulgare]